MTSTSPEVDPFAGGDSVPALSFKDAPVGTSYTGRVTEPASLVQSRDYESGNPAFWPDGNPKMSAVFKAEFDGLGERSVWAAKPSALFAALKAAQEKAGAKIAPGGTVTITYTGDGVRRDGNTRLNPPKQYAVAYAPGDPFSEPAAPAAPAAVAQVPAQPTGLPNLTPEQIAALAALQRQGAIPPF